VTQIHSSNLRVLRYAPSSSLAPHQHEQNWLCLLIGGSYQERICSREQDHQPGDLLYCPAHTTHAQQIGRTGSTKILWTPSQDSLDFLFDQGVALSHAPYLRHSPDLLSLGARLSRELDIADAFAPLAVEGLVLELVAAFGRNLGGDGTRRSPDWLLQLRQRLDESASDGFSLNNLAADVGRHPVHVARTFRKAFGCTIGGYARRVRAQKASILLCSTRRPLIDIAVECGYGSASQFSRSFKAVFGIVPSAYRALSR
jgi:AraC family transcriptional regulator